MKDIKVKIGIIVLIILLLLLHACTKTKKYDLNKEPKINMVLINKVITNSNVCDENWIREVETLIKKLDKETTEMKKIDNDKIEDFIILQNEVKRNLQELVDYIKTNETMNKEVLVDNIKTSYIAYKDYYNKYLGGN